MTESVICFLPSRATLQAHNCFVTIARSSFFRNVDPQFEEPAEIPVGDGKEPIKALRARAVCVDMEEGVISGLANRPMLGELFDHRQFITDVSGSGNNWAHGHMYYGPQYRDAIAESVRRTAEFCDSLQSFFLIHSLGGNNVSFDICSDFVFEYS